MKVSFDPKKLKKALITLCGVIPKQPRKPILSHLKVDIISDTEALFCSTDEAVFLYKKVPLESCTSKGAFTIDAKNFLELVKNFNKDTKVTVSMIDDKKIRVGQSRSRYHFNSLDHFEFPSMTIPKKDLYHTLETESFVMALKKVENATGKDHASETLKAVYIEPTKEDGFIRAVASDGVQLMICKVPGVISGPMLIPKSAVSLLIKSLSDSEECGLYSDKTSVFVKYEDGLFCSRLSARKFPDYRQLFAKGTSLHVVLELSPVREALKRSLLFSDRVFFHLYPEGNLIIRPTDHSEDSQEEIKLKSSIEKLNRPLQLGLNGVVLIQLLEQFEGDEVTLNIFSVKSPLLFQGSPNMVGLFMPLNSSC